MLTHVKGELVVAFLDIMVATCFPPVKAISIYSCFKVPCYVTCFVHRVVSVEDKFRFAITYQETRGCPSLSSHLECGSAVQ
ncbi:hypothetical protein ACHQM5_014971 [Ranunculus cassubicifolius]